MAESAIATITFEWPPGIRQTKQVSGTDENLDSRIIDAIGVLRANGRRLVKTEMTIHGEDWVYEYDSTGHIERTFRLGDVIP